jgi:hypothetical protein
MALRAIGLIGAIRVITSGVLSPSNGSGLKAWACGNSSSYFSKRSTWPPSSFLSYLSEPLLSNTLCIRVSGNTYTESAKVFLLIKVYGAVRRNIDR